MDHRRSFKRTTFAALLGALATGAGAVGGGLAAHAAPPGFALALAVSATLSGLAFLLLGGIAAGGLIALGRDSLEVAGVPYLEARARECRAGPLGRWLRRPRSGAAGIARGLRAGDWVEVRSLTDILATLDGEGNLEGLPFMPEMAARCGRRFQVQRRAEKINDYVKHTGLRRLRSTVLLERERCDGAAHGGCQANCQFLWKERWLRFAAAPVPRGGAALPPPAERPLLPAVLLENTRRRAEAGTTIYRCQMTDVVYATTPMSWGNPVHYLRDLWTGTVRPGPLAVGVAIALFNWAQQLRQGTNYPHIAGRLDKATPEGPLGLAVGDLVRVKPRAAIEATLNARNRNRGLWFDGDMLRFCGAEFAVIACVSRLIDESTGVMREMPSPGIIFEGGTATGEYLAFCPQNEAILWREIWLERAGPPAAAPRTPGT